MDISMTKTLKYLIPDSPKSGRLYRLPKIHKANNPGRPIVSANGHPTAKISEFVDFHLHKHVEALPSFIKDTTDYLKKWQLWILYHPTLLWSLWMSPTSRSIFLIPMASKPVRKFGNLVRLKCHLPTAWLQCSRWCLKRTTLHLMETIIYK